VVRHFENCPEGDSIELWSKRSGGSVVRIGRRNDRCVSQNCRMTDRATTNPSPRPASTWVVVVLVTLGPFRPDDIAWESKKTKATGEQLLFCR